jgi:predicted DNA-binding transcriptional regulator YafY
MENNKKLLALYILKTLEKCSDENNVLTQAQLIEKINQNYGIEFERKAISRNIDSLIDFGYDIVKNKKSGVYLDSRRFEEGEIAFLVDAIFSSKSIPSCYAKDLITKIMQDVSVYNTKKYKYVHKADEISRTDNKQLFLNIDMINQAIEENKKISYQYNEYDINKNLVPKKDGEEYIVNPYFMVNSRGKYYLVANYYKYDDISHYKLELITNIKIIDAFIKPIKQVVELKDGVDISKYINEHIYMFNGETCSITLKLANKGIINDLIEWFGKDVSIRERDGSLYASFKTNKQSFIYWALQYGEYIEIIEPKELRQELKQILKNLLDKYS